MVWKQYYIEQMFISQVINAMVQQPDRTRISMDILGQILWVFVFASPLITVPLVWQFSEQKKAIRLVVGLLLAGFISLILCFLSLAIIFRDGMGP